MARMLGADLSGGLYFFLTNIYLVILIGSLCLDAGITYYVSRKDPAEGILATFSVVWSVIVSVIIAALFILFYKNNNPVFKNSFLFYASVCYSLGTFLNMYFTAFFYSYDNYKIPNLVAGIINLCLLFCIPWQKSWPVALDTNMFLLIFFAATL